MRFAKNYKTLLLVFLTIAISVVLLLYGMTLLGKLDQTETRWQEFTEQSSSRLKILSNINAHLGYGGFIHNFKNYVIRKDVSLEPIIERNLLELEKGVDKYSQLDISEDEGKALNVVRKAVNLYRDRYDLAKTLVTGDLPPQVLDQVVMISDMNVVVALDALRVMVNEQFDVSVDNTRRSLNASQNLIRKGFILIPIVLLTGGSIIFIMSLLERSERERREASLMQAVARNISESLIISDSRGRIINVNPAACQMFGYSREEFIGLTIEDLVPMPMRHGHVKMREGVEGSREKSRDLRAVTSSGRELDVLISLGALQERGQLMTVAIVKDITRRKREEERLRKQKEELEKMSMLDALTGIGSRRYFDETCKELRQKGAHHSFAVFMIDVDFFKLYNDNYGHLEGDECLKKVASALDSCMHRSEDLLARYGGEEFVSILADVGESQAEEFGRTFCQAVRALGMPHVKSPHGIVTISCGVTVVNTSDPVDMHDVLEMADKALYRAKKAGRNQSQLEVVSFQAETC